VGQKLVYFAMTADSLGVQEYEYRISATWQKLKEIEDISHVKPTLVAFHDCELFSRMSKESRTCENF
jgi:hypothetical protein